MNQDKPKRFYFSDHARQRMGERELAPSTLYFVIDHGRRERSTRGIVYSLPWADIPNRFRGFGKFAPMTQIRVVLDRRGRTILTAYPRRVRACYQQKSIYNQPATFSAA